MTSRPTAERWSRTESRCLDHICQLAHPKRLLFDRLDRYLAHFTKRPQLCGSVLVRPSHGHEPVSAETDGGPQGTKQALISGKRSMEVPSSPYPANIEVGGLWVHQVSWPGTSLTWGIPAALVAGNALATALEKPGHSYADVAPHILCFLQSFWLPSAGHIDANGKLFFSCPVKLFE